ncbi:MAG: hypothetical protein WCS95_09765, partial [Lentisphaeria bacterium]
TKTAKQKLKTHSPSINPMQKKQGQKLEHEDTRKKPEAQLKTHTCACSKKEKRTITCIQSNHRYSINKPVQ